MMTVVPGRMGLRAANGMERYIPSLSNDPTSLYRRYEPHLCTHNRFPYETIRFLASFLLLQTLLSLANLLTSI